MIKVGDDVYVPRTRLGLSTDEPSALVKTRVQIRNSRTITVDLPGTGGQTAAVPSSCAHKDLALCLITIGDYATEDSLLNPLSTSVWAFCQLLLPPDALLHRFVRSMAELDHYWNLDHATHSHFIIFGHGSPRGLRFGVDGLVEVSELVAIMATPSPSSKIILSLCCQTGKAGFAKAVSSATFCRAFIAPYHSVHGAVASEFAQVFLGQHLLGGKSVKVAFNKADIAYPGRKHFRFWKNGALQ